MRSARTFSAERRGGRDERVDQTAEVTEAAALLEQAHEPLERLAEGRVRGVRGEVVASRGGLVARALLRFAHLGQESGLAHRLGRRRELRPETSHRFRQLALDLCGQGRRDA